MGYSQMDVLGFVCSDFGGGSAESEQLKSAGKNGRCLTKERTFFANFPPYFLNGIKSRPLVPTKTQKKLTILTVIPFLQSTSIL